MANELQFSTDELIQVRTAVVLAGLAISKADRNNSHATEREIETISSSAAEMAARFHGNALVQTVFGGEHGVANAHIVTMLRRPIDALEPHQVETVALQHIEEIAYKVAKARPHAEAEEFRTAVLNVCNAVANAAKRGVFLGLGGHRISVNESSTYAAIEAALYGSHHPESQTGPGVVGDVHPMNWVDAPESPKPDAD